MNSEEIEKLKEISLAIIENVENAVKSHFGKEESENPLSDMAASIQIDSSLQR